MKPITYYVLQLNTKTILFQHESKQKIKEFLEVFGGSFQLLVVRAASIGEFYS